MPSEVRTSQSTNSLSPRYDESNHPEEDDFISDNERTPEEIAAAELRTNQRRGIIQLRLNFAPISAGGMIQIHPSMKLNQASFQEWNYPSPLIPHSRELSKRRRSSRNLIRMSLARLSRLCTARANPLLHQSSFTKTVVERLYSSVLLI